MKIYLIGVLNLPVECLQSYDISTKTERKRVQRYGNINQYDGDDREKIAEELRKGSGHTLKSLNYNPFEYELQTMKIMFKPEFIMTTVKV